MSYEWGRAAEAGRWQRAVPVWFMSVSLLALASGIGVWWVRQTFVWTPLQQFYLSAYTRSAMASSPPEAVSRRNPSSVTHRAAAVHRKDLPA